MSEIGNVSVKFSASAGGLKSGTADATRSLEAFGRAAARSAKALDYGSSTAFAGGIEQISDQLAAGEIKAARFGAAVTAAFSKATASISKGVSGQLVVIDKQLQTGVISAGQFTRRLGETAGAGAERAMETLSSSLKATAQALEDGSTTADQFVENIIELSAAAAGGGIERFQAQVSSLQSAMDGGFLSAGEFTASIRDLYEFASSANIEGQVESVGRLHAAFDSGKIGARQFRDGLANVMTAFRIETISEYETAALSLGTAFKKGSISEEEFASSIDGLNEALSATILAPLNEQLAQAEEQFGATSHAASMAHAQIMAATKAIENAKVNVAKANKGENPFEGILSGLEKINGTAKVFGIEVPAVLEEVASSMAGFEGISKSVSGLIGSLGPRFAALAGPVGAWVGILSVAGGTLYAIADYFGLIESAQRIYSGKSVAAWEEEKRKIEERNAALATGSKFQSQFGGRADEIRTQMEQVRVAMSYGGSMSQESGKAALEELNRQLEAVDPKVRRIRMASEAFASDMRQASKASEEVGNDVSKKALSKYRRDYKALLASAGTMPEIQFKAKLEGLADAFDREMGKAKSLKSIGDEIARIYDSSGDKNKATVLNATFSSYDRAKNAGATDWTQVRVARLEGIKGLASGLGVDMKAPELSAFEKYTKQLKEINGVVAITAEEESLLSQARKSALKALVDDRNKYLEGLPGSKESTGSTAERAILKLNDDLAKLEEGRKFVTSPQSMLSNEERRLALSSISGRERGIMDEFMRQNEGVVDLARAGREPSRQANTASLVNTSGGMADYFRIMRGSDPVTTKQLREAQESRIILKRIEENTKNLGLSAANL